MLIFDRGDPDIVQPRLSLGEDTMAQASIDETGLITSHGSINCHRIRPHSRAGQASTKTATDHPVPAQPAANLLKRRIRRSPARTPKAKVARSNCVGSANSPRYSNMLELAALGLAA